MLAGANSGYAKSSVFLLSAKATNAVINIANERRRPLSVLFDTEPENNEKLTRSRPLRFWWVRRPAAGNAKIAQSPAADPMGHRAKRRSVRRTISRNKLTTSQCTRCDPEAFRSEL